MAARFKGVDFPFQKGVSSFPKGASDADLVKANLAQIIQTKPGERRMHPEFGVDLISLVFESITQAEIAALARDRILRAVALFEPRAQVLDLQVTTDDSRLNLTLVYQFNRDVSTLSLGIGVG